jgi:hypothetical protein
MDGGGGDSGGDKDVVIDEEGVDKGTLTGKAMAAAATPSARWHSNDDKVVVDNDDVTNTVMRLLFASRSYTHRVVG